MAQSDQIEITSAMIEAGVAAYRDWETALDYNGGSAATTGQVEELVRAILGQRGKMHAEIGRKELSEILP